MTSDVGNGRIQWYSFLCKPPGTKRAGDSWEGGASTDAQGASVIDDLRKEHEGWTEEIQCAHRPRLKPSAGSSPDDSLADLRRLLPATFYRYVLDSTPAAAVEQRDLYDRWPEFFRSWADDSTVLVGDAVHPMMPNLGQGGCQAIEDAYELTRALEEVCGATGQAPADAADVREALQTFQSRRKPRAAAVSLLSRLASDLIINFFDTPWSPHDEKGTGPLAYLTFAWKPLLQFFVFPLQFLFLYSYHPSGPMGDLPKQLEAKWKERHRVGAEAAFAKVAEEGQAVGAPSFFAKVADEAPEAAGAAP